MREYGFSMNRILQYKYSVLLPDNTGQWKPAFSHILRSVIAIMRITVSAIAVCEIKVLNLCEKTTINYYRNMKHEPACPNVVAPVSAPVVINLSNVPKQIVHLWKIWPWYLYWKISWLYIKRIIITKLITRTITQS